ncbi:hypothetical protein V6Z11_A11G081900 [Gossypium hirsutum]
MLIQDENLTDRSPFLKLRRWQWWLLVAINILFLIAGQAAAVLLGRFYYDQGGNSTWMATFVQTAGFPILCIPLIFLHPYQKLETSTSSTYPSIKIVALLYFVLGLLVAVFSYLLNSQKLTALILNSVVILSLSAALIAVNEDSDGPSGVSKGKYLVGFICTLGASALYSLLLSLMQLSFQKVLRKETYNVVLEMQIYTSLVATCVSTAGLFGSGEWKGLQDEMKGFKSGRVSYVLTLVWAAVSWQVCAVGVVGLIFAVSSLFSNVISTLSLAITPLAALLVFHDEMNGVKVIAMLLALCGFCSYIYQNYLDDTKARKSESQSHTDDVIQESHHV